MAIKNIIFDLGGVIMNLDHDKTIQGFNNLGAQDFAALYEAHKENSFFDEFEVGQISSALFRAKVNAHLKLKLSDQDFDLAWNAMLLDIPPERLDFLKNLRNQYKLFLFSNTNEIHLTQVCSRFQKKHGENVFSDYFDKEYYSHIFGKRKPDPSAFMSILNENNIAANETAFIDDSLRHVNGAKSAGLFAMHLSPGKTIFELAQFIQHIKKD